MLWLWRGVTRSHGAVRAAVQDLASLVMLLVMLALEVEGEEL